MQETITLVHDQKRNAIQFTEGKLQGADLWYPYDADKCALSVAVEQLLTLNGIALKVVSVERTQQRHIYEDFLITYKAKKPTFTVPITMATNEHPDGHNANATMSCLANGVCVSIAVHLDQAYFNCSLDSVQAEVLAVISPLSASEGISTINVEIGDDDAE